MPWFVEFAPKRPEPFGAIFTDVSAEGVDLLQR